MENNESNYCTLTRFKSSSQRHDQEMPRGANHSDNETEAANASPFVSTYCTAKRPRRPQAGQTEVTMGSQISHESVKLDENATILREKLIEQVELGKRMAESDLEDEDNEYKLLENVGLEESSFEDSLDQATYVISDGIDSSPIESFQDSLDFRAKESTRNVPKSSLENLEDLDNDQPIQANIDLFNDLLDHQEPVHQSSTQYCTLRKLSTSPSTATEADNKTIGKYCTIKLNNKQLDALHVTEHDNIYENKTLEFYLHDLDNYLNKIEGEEVCGADNSLSGVACDTLGEGELNVKASSSTSEHDLNLTEFCNESKTRTVSVDDQKCLLPQKRKLIMQNYKYLTLPKSAKLLAQRLDEEPFDRNVFQRATIAANAKQTLPNCVLNELDKHKFNGLFSTGRIDGIGDDNHHENGKRMNAASHQTTQSTSLRTPRRHLSWLRNSMRKTCPIFIPDQVLPKTLDREHQATSTSTLSLDRRTKFTSPIPEDLVSTQSAGSSVEQLEVSERQTNGRVRRNNSFVSSNILTDFLNTAATQPPVPLIIDNVENNVNTRPRQYGRRSEVSPRVVSITTEISNGETRIITQQQRPASAPNRATSRQNSQSSRQQQHRYQNSEPSSINSSRNPSPVSLVSSTGSSSIASRTGRTNSATNSTQRRPTQRNRSMEVTDLDDEDEVTNEAAQQTKNKWPHLMSRSLCTTFCTLGLFNISRFAVFSIHFGANFLVQFLILSFIFGIPMLWLQMCLGSKIKGGIVTMWRISPICKGIGITLLVAQCIIALYSAVSVAWVLVYFRDSFISRNDKYRWQEQFELYRGYSSNSSLKLAESVGDYFNGVVLQRMQLGPAGRVGSYGMGAVRFQLAFNLAILWTAVFLVLCRGLQSFGKIVFGLMFFSFAGFIAVCSKLLTLINFETVQNIFPATDWQEFFVNSKSWISAAQETFLTWGLLGASVFSMYCKTGKNVQLNKVMLRREAFIIVLVTLLGLFLASILGSSCVQILNNRGFLYFPGSFENTKSNIFLWPSDGAIPPHLASIPSKWITRYSTVLGETCKLPIYSQQQSSQRESGYQAIRLVTELFPSALASVTHQQIQPIWALIGFLTMLLFGLGQLCAMWKPIAGAIGNSPSAILLSCVTGLFLGIPLATDSGIVIIHFLDYIFGGAWWLLIVWASYLVALFMIRGRPYTSDVLVKDLQLTETFSAFVAFSWNVLLPVGLTLLAVMEYKISYSDELFHNRSNQYNQNHLSNYWPLWVKQLGGFLQLGLLVLIPCFSIIQIYRYLSKGPIDILDRIELLYRPPSHIIDPTQRHLSIRRINRARVPFPPNSPNTVISLESGASVAGFADDPPKYTPPPSYTTATGARIAKMLRNSIRRSVRRIMGESSRPRTSTAVQAANNANNSLPDYSAATIVASQTRNTVSFINLDDERRPFSEPTSLATIVAQPESSQGQVQSSRSLSRNFDCLIFTNRLGRNTRSAENLVLSEVPISISNGLEVLVLDQNRSTEQNANNDSVI